MRPLSCLYDQMESIPRDGCMTYVHAGDSLPLPRLQKVIFCVAMEGFIYE